MRARARLWWSLRTPREQRLLLAMAALIVIVLVWLLIVRPVDDSLAAARERHGRAVLDRARAREQAERIAMLERGAPPPRQAALDIVLKARADAAGLPDARVTMHDGAASILLDAVRAPAFFGWVAERERRDGLIVNRLTARANGDGTVAAEATFRARGR